MFKLKPLSQEAIPRALAKAERYRLLNEPQEAESICHDVLRTDPENPFALVTLLLSLTDQFGKDSAVGVTRPQELVARLKDEYERAYYAGIICERWAKATFGEEGARASMAASWLREAMRNYEKAEALAPPGNEDAVLRWNACARIIDRNEAHWQAAEGSPEAEFGDEVPTGS